MGTCVTKNHKPLAIGMLIVLFCIACVSSVLLGLRLPSLGNFNDAVKTVLSFIDSVLLTVFYAYWLRNLAKNKNREIHKHHEH